MNTKELIKKNLGINIKEFAISNGFDLDTLNNLLFGRTKGNREGTQAYEIKQFLILHGLYVEENEKEEIKIDTKKMKNPLLENFFLLKLNTKLSENLTYKDIVKYTHKKVPAILELYFDTTVQDYTKDLYFLDKKINDKDFSQFCFGTSDGSRIGSKAYYIKQKLIKDGIIPSITLK
ncbi:MAG: hypothetical protein WC141_09220 [Arcobacteraceae bacterium]